MNTDWENHTNDLSLRYKYVICSASEARSILEAGSPVLPLLILATSPSAGSTLKLNEYLNYISAKSTIDVHTYD
jgi:hypothetical protein